MSLRSRALLWADVLLRVPPIFIIDELLKLGLGLPQSDIVLTLPNATLNTNITGDENVTYYMAMTDTDNHNYRTFFVTFFRAFASCLGIAAASCAFMLWTKHLIIIYLYIGSVATVLASYWINVATIKTVLEAMTETAGHGGHAAQPSILEDLLALNIEELFDINSCIYPILNNYFCQCLLACLFLYLHIGPNNALFFKFLFASFLMPSLLAILPLPSSVLYHSPVFATLFPLAMLKFQLWSHLSSALRILYEGYRYARNFVKNFGLSALVETEWIRLKVPSVLRTFWMLRLSEQLVLLVFRHISSQKDFDGVSTNVLAFEFLYGSFKNLLISGCETLTAVLGMTGVVSYICHYIGSFFQWILLTEDEDDKSIGTVSAILFYILALQTGLTGLEPEKRFFRLCRNFCLLMTALLHFIHNIVNPLLMSLSASHNPSLHRHIRALGVSLFLILFPLTLLIHLWSWYETSTWLLAVSAFSVEVMVKVTVSLMIYSLFLIDAYRSTFWEKLDDYIYYIRAFGNTVEFCFGIFLFFNGAWILFFESGGAVRAVMMCIHAYFNIWCEAKAGWSVFMKRRTAVAKIESLPEADPERLHGLDDVCAICYQEMKTAKITRCNHFFHGVCLRKWLYVQDRCPLCHDILYKVERTVSDEGNAHNARRNENARQADEQGANVVPPQVQNMFQDFRNRAGHIQR